MSIPSTRYTHYYENKLEDLVLEGAEIISFWFGCSVISGISLLTGIINKTMSFIKLCFAHSMNRILPIP